MRSVTGSLHWVTGGNTSRRVVRDQPVAEETISTLVSDHKRAVQTIKRLRSQPEIGLRFRPLPTKMCVLVYSDSALHNADADPDEEGSGADWGKSFPGEWTEEHLRIRVITDCKSLFDCLAKDASVPEDRGTALTVASLREMCSAGV